MAINGIEITDVIVFPVKHMSQNESLKAFVRIVINDQFIINGIRVFAGKHGLFISFPKEYNKAEKKGYDIAFPVTAELRTYITDQVLSQYNITIAAAKAA